MEGGSQTELTAPNVHVTLYQDLNRHYICQCTRNRFYFVFILLLKPNNTSVCNKQKLVPWGTDGRLPLSDLDLDLGSGNRAYRRASLIDLYLRTKFH